MSTRLPCFALMLVFACSQAQAVLISDTVDLLGSAGSFSQSGSTFTLTGNSVTDGGITINYDLVLNLDWLNEAGASVTGFQGALHTPLATTPLGVTTSLAGGTPGSLDEEHNDIDGFHYINGTTALIREEVTFTATVTSVSGGSVNSHSFTAFESGNGGNAGIDATTLGTPSLALVVSLPNDPTGNTDDSDFRVRGLTVEFDATAVPEPSQFALLGLLGIFVCGRTWKRRLSTRAA